MLEKELVNKSDIELKTLVVELRKQLFVFNIQKATGKLQDPSKIKKTRKTIARILTILSLREKNINYISKYLKDKKDKPKKEAETKKINTKEVESLQENIIDQGKDITSKEIISVEAKETDEKNI